VNPSGYPSVNWSRGCLARFESVESFAGRFCELNKISVKQFFDYISVTKGGLWRQGWQMTDDETAAISAALDEPLAIVDSVLSPYEGHADPLANYCGNDQHPDRIKYCPTCVREGYHSYFHTLVWIDLCPFDGSELMTHSCYVGSDASTNRIGALTQILKLQWPGWPGAVPDLGMKRRHIVPRFKDFQRWILDTNKVATDLGGTRCIQRDCGHWVDSSRTEHRVHQIMALVPPPEDIAACFSKAVPAVPCLVPLGVQDTAQIHDLVDKHEFLTLIWFYRICRNSDPAGSSTREDLDIELAAIRSRQPTGCRWGHGRREGWRSVHPEEWPHWDLKRPHEVACEFLEAHYGDFRCGQSPRAADKEFFRFIECAEKFVGAGLARHHCAPEEISSEVVKRCVQNWQPWVEWTGPLSETFDAILHAGLVADVTWLNRWLTNIEKGAAPQDSPFLYPSVGLINHARGLAILSWQATKDD
jgi:hypothetical protein